MHITVIVEFLIGIIEFTIKKLGDINESR